MEELKGVLVGCVSREPCWNGAVSVCGNDSCDCRGCAGVGGVLGSRRVDVIKCSSGRVADWSV